MTDHMKIDWTKTDMRARITELEAQLAELAAENERLKETEAHRIKVIRENENILHSNIELCRKIENALKAAMEAGG